MMSNYTLTRADRATHLKIVMVSLIAGLLVVGIGYSARPTLSDGGLDNAVAVKSAKPMNWSSRDAVTIR